MQMKQWMKWILCLVVLLFCVQAALAYTVKVTSAPSTDLKANDNVKVDLEISISSFTSTHFLQFSSDLTGTNCVAQRYHGDTGQYESLQVQQDRTGKWMLLGWLLQSEDSYTLQVTFTGKVPSTISSANVTVLRIQELSGESVISGSEFKIERPVVNPQEITSQIASVRTELQTFKDTITTQGGSGVDITAASGKAKDAENALAAADSLKSSSFSQAAAKITTARTAIQDGYTLLDKAGAQYEINKVEQTMTQVESMVTYFTNNRSISQTDSRMVAITNKYDLASQSLSSANDLVAEGNFLNGKAKAIEASKYADDAYNLSTALKTELGEGGIGLPGINPLFLALGIGVIVLGAVGYFAYRKYFRWDELG
jgi:hypothetical protein